MPTNPITLYLAPYMTFSAEILFLVIVVLFLLFSLVLGYHVLAYSLNKRKAKTWFVIFLIIGMILVGGMSLTLSVL